MARSFNGSSDYLELASAVLTAVPVTMACWYKPVTTNTEGTLMELGTASSNFNYFWLFHGSDNRVKFQAADGVGGATAASTVGTTAGTWTHACGVSSAVNSRAAYINGGSKGTDVGSRTPAGINRTSIGVAQLSTGRGDYKDAHFAEAAIWNVALNDSEVAALGRGVSPLYVRTANLLAYWPIWGLHDPEINLVSGGGLMTVSSPTQSNHAPVPPFSRRGQTVALADPRRWLFGAH